MDLQLASTKVKKIILEEREIESDENSFNFIVGASAENKNIFVVIFNLKISDEHENYFLETTYEASFITNEEIDDNFMNSNFPKINAPAIAFPYFRAFISTITQQAGFNTVVLPSVNFIKYAEDMSSDQDE